MKKLTKEKALILIPLIVDNEASENDKLAFFRYIQNDDEVRKKYESLIFVKQLLKTKYSPEKAPDHVKKRVLEMIEDMKWEHEEKSKVDNNSLSVKEKSVAGTDQYQHESDTVPSPLFNIMKPMRYLVAATVIFIFSLLTIEFLKKTSTDHFQRNYDIEEVALSHINTGNHLTSSLASYQPISLNHASEILKDEMSHQLRLPSIDGANLRRVFQITFADGYTTPVLEFFQKGINETVHVFAFRLNDLEKEGKMIRDPEAVKLCKTFNDYHIKEINDKHVVSWKWGEYWYTAISNHNGDDLIALLEPTGSDWENEENDGN